MALGPDPNRVTESDPDVKEMGDPPFGRLFLPSWATALLAVLIALGVIAVMVF